MPEIQVQCNNPEQSGVTVYIMMPKFALATVLTLSAMQVWAAPASSPLVDLALNRPFISSSPMLPGWTGLVDGIKDSDTAPGCYATSNDPSYPKSVVVDLGSECSISKVILYNSTNGNTRTVSLACSTDGVHYQKLRDPDFIFADGDAIPLSVSFPPRQARYVRVSMLDTWKGGLGGDNCLFLRELEVFGTQGTSTPDNSLAFAVGQPPLVSTRSVDVFRRYCLNGNAGDLSIAAVGDWTVSGADTPGHWAQVFVSDLAKSYPEKHVTVTTVGGSNGAISYGLAWAREHRGLLAPDIVLLSYGAQAAAAGADVKDFRSKYQALVNELVNNTASLVIAVTPQPFLQSAGLPVVGNTSEASTAPFAWAVEQVAMSRGLPVLRTASLIARTPGDKSALYADNLHLNETGNRLVGQTLADLFK